MITVTSLVHPTMIVKIRQGLKLAALGRGHEMGGHGNRVYIPRKLRKGETVPHNIMRIDWLGNGKFVCYGGADWGQTDVTEIVKQAIQRGCSSNRVKPRELDCDKSCTPLEKDGIVVGYKQRAAKALFGVFALVLLVALPDQSAYADKPPTALESACIKQPELLVCQWVANSLEKMQNNALHGGSTL
jgi:hypothetical protein